MGNDSAAMNSYTGVNAISVVTGDVEQLVNLRYDLNGTTKAKRISQGD